MAICPHCQTKTETVLTPCPTGDGYFCIEEKEHASYPDDSLLGRQISGRFIVVSVIGRGSMGHVYKAIQGQVDRSVALKIFRPEHMPGSLATQADEKARESAQHRFVQEARVLGKLSHPNCVTLYDFGVSDEGDFLYIAMEYVAGISMRRAVGRGMKFAAIAEVTRQILYALREAHSMNIVHRDLKPENIVLSFRVASEEQVVKVLDFGIAKLLQQGAAEQVTAAGLLFGTPAYMSPEQCRGEVGSIGPASDIYALGCILYEMVVGHLPYESQYPQEMVRMHQTAEIPDVVPRSGLEVPVEFKEFIKRCLAKRPEDRFATARNALTEFEKSVGDAYASTGRALEGLDNSARKVVVPGNKVRGEELSPMGAGKDGGGAGVSHDEVATSPGTDTGAVSQKKVSVGNEETEEVGLRPRVSETMPGELMEENPFKPRRPILAALRQGQTGMVIAALVAVTGFCLLLFYYIYTAIMGG